MRTIKAGLGSFPCLVNIGLNIGKALAQSLRAAGSGRVFVVSDAHVYALHQKYLASHVKTALNTPQPFVLPSGEKSKSDRVLAVLYDHLLEQGIARDDLILAVGGGVTTDLAGFAAATILRGVRWAAVPTTLLGMVDAALGGKTGINHVRGKNLVGAFWQPAFVHTDLQFLSTLDRRELMAGLGEVIKYAALVGNRPNPMLDECERLLGYWETATPRDFQQVVLYSAACKLGIVRRDERETGHRMRLNFGHTFGHAIERTLGYGRFRHGEAVILGMLAALELGEQLGYRSTSGERFRALVETCVSYLPRRELTVPGILQHMNLDKKRTSAGLKFVLIERPGKPIICSKVDRRKVSAAVDAMLKFYRTHGGVHAHDNRC